mgnify:FL=1
MLLVLTGVYTFNFIDRQILVILQESIKKDLGLTDTHLGMLTGLTFALFYATLGIPIARYADRSNRRNIVGISLIIWSLMTAVSGLVNNFVQLLIARIGVGIGEAGGSPPSHSIVSDYYPPHKRASALAIYSTGIYIGILFGYMIGGWIDENYGWRMAFFALGLPGVLYAMIVFLTVKEPRRGMSDNRLNNDDAIAVRRSKDFLEVLTLLLKKKTFVFISLAAGFNAFVTYGIGNFFAPFLARIHHMETASIGVALGLVVGVGGITGTYAGGYFADRLGKRDIRWYLYVPILAGLVVVPFSITSFLHGDLTLVLACNAVATFLTAVYMGPSLAVIHNLVDAHTRALASAVFFLILNLIGLGLGPLTIGYISDLLSTDYGVESLRYAFMFSFIPGTISIILFYLASRTYKHEVAVI